MRRMDPREQIEAEMDRARTDLRDKQEEAARAHEKARECDHEVALATAYLRGIELGLRFVAPEHRPITKPPVARPTAASPNVAPPARSGPKGRQLGAISKIWRAILDEMANFYPEGASDEQIADLGRMDYLPNLRAKDARRQMQKYQGLGFVEYAHPVLRTWRITPTAAERFGIHHPESKAATDSQSAAAPETSDAERV